MYVNVAFPLRISPLTYKAPAGAPVDLIGRIVRAPLMGRSIYGLVMSTCEGAEMKIKKEIRDIQAIYQSVMSPQTIAFIQWLADYYISPVGTALRSTFFEEITAIVTKKAEEQAEATIRPESFRPVTIHCEAANNAVLSHICTDILLNEYRSFLYHAESTTEERLLLMSALMHLKDSLSHAVILVPEIAHLEHIVPSLKNLFGGRLCVLHSKLTRKETAGALGKIITGESDIIAGTRSAILAPLKKISFIAVLAEHSRFYKAEEGLRYNGRDIAVMRGFHEKATVLISSICPSVESMYNVKNGKYVMLSQQTEDKTQKTNKEKQAWRPKIKIVSMRGPGSDQLPMTPDILREARLLASRKERFLFLVSRKGYSLLRCKECGFILRCGTCNVPLVFHKGEGTLRCHYCGFTEKSPEVCVQCGGTAIEAYGAGTERVKEQVEALLKAEALIVEKGRSASRAFGEKSSDLAPLVIGTSFVKGLTYRKDAGGEERPFGAAAFLNMDALLLQPDFRLYERAFQEVMAVAQLVRTDGTVYLQTKMPENRVLRFIRAYDFEDFYRYELSQRKAFNNPPFVKLILFTVPVLEDPGPLIAEMQRTVDAVNTGKVDILGPVDLPYHSKKYHSCIQLLLKAKDRNVLHDTARLIMRGLGKLKKAKVIVEVDPLKI